MKKELLKAALAFAKASGELGQAIAGPTSRYSDEDWQAFHAEAEAAEAQLLLAAVLYARREIEGPK